MTPLKQNRSYYEYTKANWQIIPAWLIILLIFTVAYVEGGGMNFMAWFMAVIFAFAFIAPIVNWYTKG